MLLLGEVEVPGVLIHLLLQPRDLLSCFPFQAHFFQISAGSLKINNSRRMLETLTFQFRKTWRFFWIHGLQKAISCEGIWVFPKIVGFPPKWSISIGFSIIFTIHFLGETSLFLVQHPYKVRSTLCPKMRPSLLEKLGDSPQSFGHVTIATPPKTNGWNLKIPSWQKEEHLQTTKFWLPC